MTRKEKWKISITIITLVVSICVCTFVFGILGIYGEAFFTSEFTKEQKENKYTKQNEKATQGQLVFFGDSITEMYKTESIYTKYTVYNRGISGDITSNMLKRLHNNALSIKPKVLVMLGGANDLNRNISVEDIADNIEKMIVKTKEEAPKCKIIVQSVYPFNKTYKLYGIANATAQRENGKVVELNKLIVQIAQRNECEFVDIHSALLDEQGELAAKYALDGLHINKLGYEVVTSKLSPLIDKYMNAIYEDKNFGSIFCSFKLEDKVYQKSLLHSLRLNIAN